MKRYLLPYKRCLGLVLAFSLLLGCAPFGAFAEEMIPETVAEETLETEETEETAELTEEPTEEPTEPTEETMEPTEPLEAQTDALAEEEAPEESLPGKKVPLGDFAVAGVGTKELSASTVQLSQKTLIAVPYPGAALTVFVRDGYQACVYSGNNSNSINQSSGWLGSDGDGTSLYTCTLPAGSIYMRLSLRRTDGAAMEGADLGRSGLAVSYECSSDVVADNPAAASVLQQTGHPVLIHISDIHGDVIRAQRAAQFADAVGADALLASGDLTAYDPDDWGGALFEAVGTYPNVNFLYGVGNHDAKGFSGTAYQETIYNGYFRNNPSTPNGETYFYRDVPGQKLRLISVNQQEGSATNSRGGTCYSQAQVDWLVEALRTTPAGYGVVMMYHSPETAITGAEDPAYSGFFQIGNRYDTPTNSTSGYTGTLLMDLVDAFMLRESYTWSYSEKDGTSPVTVNADFTQVAQGAEFIAHLTGHVHSDSITYLPGTACKQLLLGVTCTTSMYGAEGGYYGLADYSDLVREADTANQDAFNAYIIDRESKTVRVLRIGAKQTASGQLREEMTIPYSAPFEAGDYLFDTQGLRKLDLSDVEWVNYGIQEYGPEPTYKPGLRYSTNAVLDVPYEGVTFYIKINAPYELGIRSGETDTTMTTNYYWLNNKQLTSGNQDRGFVYTLPAGHEKFILSFANVKRNASGNVVTAENLIGELERKAAGLEIWYSPEPAQESAYQFDTRDKTKLDLSDVEWVNYGIQEYGPEPTYKPGLRYSTNAILDVPYEGVTFYIKINAPYELGIRSGETDTTMTTNYYWLNNKQLISGNQDRGFVYTLPAGHEKFILSFAHVKRDASGNVVTAENPIGEPELQAAGLEIWYKPLEEPLAGKTVSILGDSISTFAGVSNSTACNSTIGSNAVFYTDGKYGITRADTWWQQTFDALDLRLLVNNSWSGSCIFNTHNDAPGAYLDRCVQLHNDTTGEEPDIIAVFLGTNDFSYYQSTLGTADIDYAALIMDNGDGTYTYAAPTTSCEAYAIMLHKMTVRYPDSDIYCMNLMSRRDPDKEDGYDDVGQPTAFNAELAKIISRLDCTLVDLENCGIDAEAENFDTYMGDGYIHPNAAGMDKITQAFVKSVLDEDILVFSIKQELSGVSSEMVSSGIPEDVGYYAACGDSITHANHAFVEDIDIDDAYYPIDGYSGTTYARKNYAYYIAERNNLLWANYGYGGTTLHYCYPKGYGGTSMRTFPFVEKRITQLKEGVEWDYISIFFGYNDVIYGPAQQRDFWLTETYGEELGYPVEDSQIGTEGFANAEQKAACDAATGSVGGVEYTDNTEFFFAKFVGTVDDTQTTTFLGAYNYALDYLSTKYPNAKIMIVNPYVSGTNNTRKIIRNGINAVAEKWGVTCMDFSDLPYWFYGVDQKRVEFPNPSREDGRWYAENGKANFAGTVEGFNRARFTTDGTHPSNLGYQTISKPMERALTDSNNTVNVLQGGSFETELVLDDVYTDMNVSVTMGGADITDQCYANGKICIESVTGDVIIRASGNITYTDVHVYSAEITAPTCTEKGYTTHTCVICGDSYRGSYVEALGTVGRTALLLSKNALSAAMWRAVTA